MAFNKSLMNFLDSLVSLGGILPNEVSRFIKYNFASVLATGTDIFLYWIFVQFFGVYYLISATITFCIGLTINYLMTRFWAFNTTKRKFFSGFLFFSAVALFTLVLAILLLAFLVEVLNLNYLVARILVAFIILPIGYLLNYFVTFR